MNLYEAISNIKNKKQCKNVFKDLCTPKEMAALEERWEVAKLLNTKQYTYREIAQMVGASTTTVTRVARFMFNEKNKGYSSLLKP
ncbi:MAG: YerC/YecD family TrpR-related protein [Gammaproteobacteria bacterium]|jgi:TrpR-related protein YerC/YecD